MGKKRVVYPFERGFAHVSTRINEPHRSELDFQTTSVRLRLRPEVVREVALSLANRLDEALECQRASAEEHDLEEQVPLEMIGLQEVVGRFLANWRTLPLPKLRRMANGTVCIHS